MTIDTNLNNAHSYAITTCEVKWQILLNYENQAANMEHQCQKYLGRIEVDFDPVALKWTY